MKHPYRTLFCAVSAAGAAGLLLRFWLFSAIDGKGLLPSFHIAQILLYLLTAAVILSAMLILKKLPFACSYRQFFAPGLPGAIGTALAAPALAVSLFLGDFTQKGPFGWILIGLGILSAAAFLLIALCRKQGKKPGYGLLVLITVFSMVHIIVMSRAWGASPQTQTIFFPFMASLFFMLSSYQHTAFSVRRKNGRSFLFTTLCCLFFSLISLCPLSPDTCLFYLAAALYSGAGLFCFREETP